MQVHPLCIAAFLPVQIGWQGNQRVAFLLPAAGGLNRVFQQACHRNVLIHDIVDEGAVGAVFQQPAHQVGEQVGVHTDRGIHPAGHLFGIDNLVVECFAHAV